MFCCWLGFADGCPIRPDGFSLAAFGFFEVLEFHLFAMLITEQLFLRGCTGDPEMGFGSFNTARLAHR